MPITVDGHTVMLNSLGTAAKFVSLAKATTLTAAAAVGATTVALARAVKVADYISLNNGTNQEVRQVTAIANGGLTATVAALAFAYPVNSDVGHAPKLGADIVEPTGGGGYQRQAMAWASSANENLTVSPTALPNFPVAGGNKIGGFAIHTVATGVATGTVLGTFLTQNIESFGAAGTYQLSDADVNLFS